MVQMCSIQEIQFVSPLNSRETCYSLAIILIGQSE